MTRLTILTGASRGLGAAMAEQLLQRGGTLLTLSRNVNAGLMERAAASAATLEQWTLDLAQPVQAAARLEAWLETLDGEGFEQATLINNAAMITDIGPLEDLAAGELSSALRVGLEAPLLLTAAFLRATRAWRARRLGTCRVLNISSGLGRFARASQACYCAVKAGMDHFSRSVALDQTADSQPAHIVSLAPGVIDTDMQTRLRAANPARFPDHARFVHMKESGQLDAPAVAAAKVLAFLERADFGEKPVADIRDA
ncbi:MAG: SDR family NAD(P)-dependent oxidoreductase [Betaproteobacteria bacterium]|nr:SDR family NAD(P)-dependent oxidoreductase [Betaproteobacteria bacterium]MDH5537523.1 SDR family NAD(P)-dependent oxidoreductase [Betaproteobacteria bacterium]